MKVQHRSFSLFELLVGLVLTSVLIGFLIVTFRQVNRAALELDVLEPIIHDQRVAHYRLYHVLSEANLGLEEEEGFCFFTNPEGNVLYFTYVHDPDIEPHFSADVIGMLHRDERANLCLTTWPIREKWDFETIPSRHEVLLPQVTGVRFEFYVPPAVDELAVKTKGVVTGKEEVTPERGIHSTWLPQYASLPATMKLLVEQVSGEELEFGIDFRYAHYPLKYPKRL